MIARAIYLLSTISMLIFLHVGFYNPKRLRDKYEHLNKLNARKAQLDLRMSCLKFLSQEEQNVDDKSLRKAFEMLVNYWQTHKSIDI